MGKPKPPDPKEQAAAQTGTNIATQLANTTMNPSISTPFGTSTTTQTGTTSWTDPYTGQSYDLPQYETAQQFSPQFQGFFDRAAESANTGIDDRLYDLARARVDPRMAERRSALETRLANQGITPGSEAYNREMTLIGQQENDAYNSLLLQGRNQALQEQNNPLNQAIGLLHGVPVNAPNTNIPTVDVAGLENSAYQQKAANYNNLMGGLLSAGGTLLGAPMQGTFLGGLFGR